MTLSVQADKKKSERYEVRGRISPPLSATVALHGTTTPFQALVQAGLDGKFRFQKVPPDVYHILVYHTQRDDHRTSVHVGPRTADSKGRIEVLLKMKSTHSAPEKMTTVKVDELAIPDKALNEYARAQKCLTRNDTACAIAHLEHAVRIAPRFSAAWNHLGTIAHQSGRNPDALRYFQLALEADPEAYHPLVNMGGTLIHLHRLEEALRCNQKAVQLHPEDPLAQSQLGLTHFGLGSFDLAEKSLREAERLDPAHFTQPQLWLAEVFMRRGNRSGAMEKLEAFFRYHPNSPDVEKFRPVLDKLKAEKDKEKNENS